MASRLPVDKYLRLVNQCLANLSQIDVPRSEKPVTEQELPMILHLRYLSVPTMDAAMILYWARQAAREERGEAATNVWRKDLDMEGL